MNNNSKICVTFAGAVGSSKTPITNYISTKINSPIFNNMSEIPKFNPETQQEIKKIEKIKLDEFDTNYFKTLEGEDGWIAIGQENCTNQRYFTICSEDDERVGIIGVYDTEEDKNITHTVVDPKFRGQGIAAKCKESLMDTLDLPFITLTISLDNKPSLNAAQKLPNVQMVSDEEYELRCHKKKYILTRPEEKINLLL
jgi:hypothetical protein